MLRLRGSGHMYVVPADRLPFLTRSINRPLTNLPVQCLLVNPENVGSEYAIVELYYLSEASIESISRVWPEDLPFMLRAAALGDE